MCGVVCVALPEPLPDAAMAAALAALAHRGPDGRGTWRSPDGTIALGHTRLAVIDPAGGAQPIANEDGSIVAVVNGELYGNVWQTDKMLRISPIDGHVLGRVNLAGLLSTEERQGGRQRKGVRSCSFVLCG